MSGGPAARRTRAGWRRAVTLTLLALAIPVVALLAVVAALPFEAVDRATPDTGYSVETGIPYGPLDRQRLDLYRPEAGPERPATIVFFYGGSWREGERADYRFVGHALATAGYRVAIPDYRLYPEVTFPAFIEDGAAAVAEVRRRLPGPVVLSGYSAGAHLAVMLALDQRFLAAQGVDADRTVAAAVGVAGLYDFLPIPEKWAAALEVDGDQEPSQPIRYVRPDAPPLLLVHGEVDWTVAVVNARRLAAAVAAAGGDVSLITYAFTGHASIMGAMAAPLSFLAPVRDDILAWLAARGL